MLLSTYRWPKTSDIWELYNVERSWIFFVFLEHKGGYSCWNVLSSRLAYPFFLLKSGQTPSINQIASRRLYELNELAKTQELLVLYIALYRTIITCFVKIVTMVTIVIVVGVRAQRFQLFFLQVALLASVPCALSKMVLATDFGIFAKFFRLHGPLSRGLLQAEIEELWTWLKLGFPVNWIF